MNALPCLATQQRLNVMSRRAKKQPIIRPVLTQEFFKFEYLCPTCDKKVWQDFSMLTPASASVQTTNSYWCKNQDCGVTHKVIYRLFKKRDGEPKIKVFEFISNGEPYTKRFKPLNLKQKESIQ